MKRMGKGKKIVFKCSYHLCKEISKLKKYTCKYCKERFCAKHFDAKAPYVPDFRDNSRKNIRLMEESKKEDAHPCAEYIHYIEKQFQEQRDKDSEAQLAFLRQRDQEYISQHPPGVQPKELQINDDFSVPDKVSFFRKLINTIRKNRTFFIWAIIIYAIIMYLK